jgi:hypothetical protein
MLEPFVRLHGHPDLTDAPAESERRRQILLEVV